MAIERTGVLLDLDGTLVDSVFHHVLAWDDAFKEGGFDAPLWRVHAAVGMGSERVVCWVLGRSANDLGDAVSELQETHTKRFLDRAGDLRATNGALALLDDLDGRQVPYMVATSATGPEADALLAALGRDDLPLATGDDVPATKPAPDPLLQACAELGVDAQHTIMVGDSPWDCEAAARIAMRSVAVRTGGFAAPSLLAAGAASVVDDPRALIARL